MLSKRARRYATAALFALGLAAPNFAEADTTLRAVMQSDLKILDPIWTTAYIVRNYGYMVYDTLFAMDAEGQIKPQMVDTYSVSPDNLTWTFTLRDGLLFHDGAPVTSDDCIASIKRWGAKDAMGQTLMIVRQGDECRRRQDVHHHAQRADRPDAASSRQAVVKSRVHHAEARRRDAAQPADQGNDRLRAIHLQGGRVEAGRQGGVRQIRQIQASP